jgi:hypothetical protein
MITASDDQIRANLRRRLDAYKDEFKASEKAPVLKEGRTRVGAMLSTMPAFWQEAPLMAQTALKTFAKDLKTEDRQALAAVDTAIAEVNAARKQSDKKVQVALPKVISLLNDAANHPGQIADDFVERHATVTNWISVTALTPKKNKERLNKEKRQSYEIELQAISPDAPGKTESGTPSKASKKEKTARRSSYEQKKQPLLFSDSDIAAASNSSMSGKALKAQESDSQKAEDKNAGIKSPRSPLSPRITPRSERAKRGISSNALTTTMTLALTTTSSTTTTATTTTTGVDRSASTPRTVVVVEDEAVSIKRANAFYTARLGEIYGPPAATGLAKLVNALVEVNATGGDLKPADKIRQVILRAKLDPGHAPALQDAHASLKNNVRILDVTESAVILVKFLGTMVSALESSPKSN